MSGPVAGPSWEEPRRPRRRAGGQVVALAAAAGLVVAAVLVAAVAAGGPGAGVLEVHEAGGGGARTTPAPRRSVAPAPPPRDWAPLPHSPLVRRHGHAMAWAAGRVVVWGGARTDERRHATGMTYLRSGASFDPATGVWRRLPAAPVPGSRAPVLIAAGQRVIVWGGEVRRSASGASAGTAHVPTVRRSASGASAGTAHVPTVPTVRRSASGAAVLDLGADRWRRLPAGPLDGAEGAGGAWTGTEALVWGSLDGRFAAAAYDLGEARWRRLPDPPLSSGDVTAAWAGGRLLALAPAPGGGSEVATYDPAGGWRRRADLTGAAAPVRLLAAGASVLVWAGPRADWAAAYDPVAGTARRLGRPPLHLALAELVSAWTGHGLLLWRPDHDLALLLDPASGRTATLPRSALAGREDTAGVWTEHGLVVWGGRGAERHHADGALLPLARVLEAAQEVRRSSQASNVRTP